MTLHRAILAVLLVGMFAVHELGQTPAAGVIEVLVNTANESPIEDAEVTLIFTPFPTYGIVGGTGGKEFGELHVDSTRTTAKSDRGGRAIFRNLGPGSYRVLAEREGFNKTHAGESAVQIGTYPQPPSLTDNRTPPDENFSAPSTTRHVRLILGPAGTISGRIQDQAGRPVPNTIVAALQWAYEDGEKRLRVANSVGTDELGEYQFPMLASGEYYIRVSGHSEKDGVLTEKGIVTYPESTYFPGTPEPKSASPIGLNEGQNVTGVNVTIPDRRGATIKGKIVNLLPEVTASPDKGRRGGPARFLAGGVLIPAGKGFAEMPATLLAGRLMDPNMGREFPFEIRFVPPGEYDFYPLIADQSSLPQTNYTGRTRISVGSSDVQNVVAKVEEGTEIHGRFHYSDGSTSPPDLVNDIEFIPLEPLPSRPSFTLPDEVVEDGPTGFKIANRIEARYRLAPITDLPDSDYLSDIRVDGQSVLNEGTIIVGREPIDLELVIGRGGGRIDGSVILPPIEDLPVAIAVTVVLVPDEPRRGNTSLYRRTKLMATPSSPGIAIRPESGRFSFKSLAPGSYKIFAWEDLPQGGAEMNPDFLAKYEGRGIPIKVEPGLIMTDIRVPIIRAP